MADTGVVHLVWVPLGLEPFERFLASYRRFPGGQEHDLIFIFNGHQQREDLAVYQRQLHDLPHQELIFDTPQQDIASYFAAARALSHRYLCFVNSHSELLDAEWLHKLYAHGSKPEVGVAGASASWQGKNDAGEREDYSLWRHYAVKVIKYRWLGKDNVPFPNPHLRTNAFLIDRERFLSLYCAPVRVKRDAYEFEHGKQSMTRQLRKRRLKTLMVGRDGRAYEPEDWPLSGVVYRGDQANLLVADNQTRFYEEADEQLRRRLIRISWGKKGS